MGGKLRVLILGNVFLDKTTHKKISSRQMKALDARPMKL